MDKGPWFAGKCTQPDARHKFFLESQDFQCADARLYINGDFGGDEVQWQYALALAFQLNANTFYVPGTAFGYTIKGSDVDIGTDLEGINKVWRLHPSTYVWTFVTPSGLLGVR